MTKTVPDISTAKCIKPGEQEEATKIPAGGLARKCRNRAEHRAGGPASAVTRESGNVWSP